MRCDKKSLLLYAVTDRSWVGKLTLYEQVELALKGGATCVQLREKELDENAFLEEAIAVGKLCRAYRVPFLIDDDAGVAVQSGADGVHVGQCDMSAGDVRKMIGGGMILGVSAQTVAQAVQAEKDGADYLGVGAVFATSTKLDAETVSLETLKAICASVSIPVVAIGGIGRQNILRLAGTGVDGVALVSAVFGSPDIEAECRVLRALSEEMVSA